MTQTDRLLNAGEVLRRANDGVDRRLQQVEQQLTGVRAVLSICAAVERIGADDRDPIFFFSVAGCSSCTPGGWPKRRGVWNWRRAWPTCAATSTTWANDSVDCSSRSAASTDRYINK